MSHDIVLVSNASMNIFPENKLSDFRVRLPQPITLDPEYRVALTRISWTKSFFNYEGGTAWIMLSDTKARMDPEEAVKKRSVLSCDLVAGFYNPESFIAMLNDQTKLKISLQGGGLQINEFVEYKLTNGYLVTKPGKIDAGQGIVYHYYLGFDKDTEAVLGIDKEDQRPVFLNQAVTDLYVYSDICYPSIVGDQTCELLTILDGQTEASYGSHCCEVWEQPWYHKLTKTSFQEIRIYIRTDTGKAPRFRFGRVCLRLSFKKEDDI